VQVLVIRLETGDWRLVKVSEGCETETRFDIDSNFIHKSVPPVVVIRSLI
jgi:hypothetical protein